MLSILNRALSWAITSLGNKFCLKKRSRLIKATDNRFYAKFIQLEIGLLRMTKHPSRKVMNFRHLLGCDTIEINLNYLCWIETYHVATYWFEILMSKWLPATLHFFGIISRSSFYSFRSFFENGPAASQIFCKGCRLGAIIVWRYSAFKKCSQP